MEVSTPSTKASIASTEVDGCFHGGSEGFLGGGENFHGSMRVDGSFQGIQMKLLNEDASMATSMLEKPKQIKF